MNEEKQKHIDELVSKAAKHQCPYLAMLCGSWMHAHGLPQADDPFANTNGLLSIYWFIGWSCSVDAVQQEK